MTHLERYLQSHGEDGVEESTGSFTLSSEASAKLGKFQLPFPGAWALKIVQAAVANDCQAIEVVCTRRDVQFRLLEGKAWSLKLLELAFSRPQDRQERPVGHLLTALRGLGLGESRDFSVSFGEEKLLWSEGFRRTQHTPASRGLTLQISHGRNKSSASNAEVLTALANYAYTCPIPLSVDQRRLDVLQYCPDHGWGKTSFPIAIGLGTCDLPKLSLPPGGLIAQTAPDKFLKIENPGQVPLIWMLTAHLKRKIRISTCYFVCDGVEVAMEPFLDHHLQGISLNAFISAEGLDTDASSLAPLRREEYHRRVKLAGRTLLSVLRTYKPDLKEYVKHSSSKKFMKRGLIFALLFVVPGLNLWAMINMLAAGYDESILASSVEDSWPKLSDSWATRYDSIPHGSESKILGKAPLVTLG